MAGPPGMRPGEHDQLVVGAAAGLGAVPPAQHLLGLHAQRLGPRGRAVGSSLGLSLGVLEQHGHWRARFIGD